MGEIALCWWVVICCERLWRSHKNKNSEWQNIHIFYFYCLLFSYMESFIKPMSFQCGRSYPLWCFIALHCLAHSVSHSSYILFKKKVKQIECTVRFSPRLSPSGPLKMRHSSICPKAENMTRMSFSLHFFDTMPMNSFRLPPLREKKGGKKLMWHMVKKKKDFMAAFD